EDAVGVRRDERSVLVDENDVHAAEFLDVLALARVEKEHLVAPVVVGLLLSEQRRGVVTAGLGCTGTTVGRTGVLRRQPDADRRNAAREVRSRGASDDVVG